MERFRHRLEMLTRQETLWKPGKETDTGKIEKVNAAYAFFTQASINYSRSITGQSASIALSCNENNYQPEELGSQLLSDSKKIEAVRNAANRLHETRGKGPYNEQKQLITVTIDHLTNIIRSDFTTAQSMMILEVDQIKRILSLHSHYYPIVDGVNREGEYNKAAFFAINKIRIQQNLPIIFPNLIPLES